MLKRIAPWIGLLVFFVAEIVVYLAITHLAHPLHTVVACPPCY